MCDLPEEEQLQNTRPGSRCQLLPYFLLVGLFLIGLLVYYFIPINP